MNTIILYLLCFGSGYLIGSILFAQLFLKIIWKSDIRNIGNQNPGAQNLYLHVSKVIGELAGLLDALKAFIPMLLAYRLFTLSDFHIALIGIGALFGHIYPLYFKFRGGKGAAVITGLFLFYIRWELLAAFVVAPFVVYIAFNKNQGVWLPFAFLMSAATFSMFAPHPEEVKTIILAVVILGWTYNIRSLPTMVKMLLKRE
jgi:glycerol-3-phosphate acyltransferase PlsY